MESAGTQGLHTAHLTAGDQFGGSAATGPLASAHLYDVTPRDGLQLETEFLEPAMKAQLIRRSIAVGLRRIEAVSFVSPKAVPQMADAEAVLESLGDVDGAAILAGLVLNVRGVQRAVQTSVTELNAVVVAPSRAWRCGARSPRRPVRTG